MGNIITNIIKKIQKLRTKNIIKKLKKNNKIIIDDNIHGNLKLDVRGVNNVISLTNISIPSTKSGKIIYIRVWK